MFWYVEMYLDIFRYIWIDFGIYHVYLGMFKYI